MGDGELIRKFLIALSILIILLYSCPNTLLAYPGEELKLKATDYFSSSQIELARIYKIPKYWMWAGENLLLVIFLCWLIFTPLGTKTVITCEKLAGSRKWLIPSFYSISLIILWSIITFPLDFYRGFLYEHNFSLTNQSFSDWLKQYLIADFINILIFILLVNAFYGIMKFSPGYWWVLCGIGFGIFTIISVYLLPIVIFPLFNKFEPLPEGKLRNITIEIGRKAGLGAINEIYVMDASRQTKKGNAYFVGLWKTKRIVLYDNLRDAYTIEETASVIAHEAGHWKHNHIIKGICFCVAGGFCFLFCTFLVLGRAGKWFGLSSPGDVKSLPLILLMLLLVNIISLPLQNSISRHFEREADMEALKLTDDPDSFIKVEQKLALQNLSEITPNKFLAWLFYTHPPVMERISMAEWFRIQRKKGTSISNLY